MKTLSHYQNLREDYACIIPKTAPAWELIEAIDDLIKLIQPHPDAAPGTRIVDASGVSVPFPEGWSLVPHNPGWVLYTLHDVKRQRGIISKTKRNSFLVEFDNVTIGDFNNLPGALCCLSNASVNVPVESQPHFLGVPVNLPEGWKFSYHTSTGEIVLRDTESFENGVAIITSKSTYAMWWNNEHAVTLETQKEAVEWLCDKANTYAS
jgi:hypothetical protein